MGLYFVNDRLAGSSVPKNPEHLNLWARLGVKYVVNLAEDWELEFFTRWNLEQYRLELESRNMEMIHWPTPDGEPPRDLRDLVKLVRNLVRLNVVLVHCIGGIGRTPTVLTAYLIDEKCMPVDEALGKIAELEPDISISDSQYYALQEYYLDKCSRSTTRASPARSDQ